MAKKEAHAQSADSSSCLVHRGSKVLHNPQQSPHILAVVGDAQVVANELVVHMEEANLNIHHILLNLPQEEPHTMGLCCIFNATMVDLDSFHLPFSFSFDSHIFVWSEIPINFYFSKMHSSF